MSSSSSTPSSLQRQLLLWLLGPMVALFVVNSVLGYRVAITTANEAYDRLLLASAKAISDRIAFASGEITVDIPYVALELFESNIRERIFYKVSAPDGSTLTGYEDLPPPPAGASLTRPTFFNSHYHGESLYQVALHKPLYEPTLKGMVLVQVGETAESREALTRRILYDNLVPQGLLVTFAAIFLALGVRHALRPLLRLRDSVAARAATDLTPVDASRVQPEVRPLIEALNTHTLRLERMIASRIDFVTDATHQIRTRLSILRTQIEYGLRLEDTPSLRGVLESAHGIVGEAGRFFNQLLVLAHAEAKAIPGLDTTAVDIAALAHATALEWVASAREKRINLGFEGVESGAVVRGNEVLLGELLANLLDNAIRYTQAGGVVTMRVRPAAGEMLVEIEDNGPGIPADLLPRLTREPVTTKAAAGSSGMGLVFCQRVMQSIGGEIAIHCETAAGTSVSLLFKP